MKQGFTKGFWLLISLLSGLTGWPQAVIIRGKVADQATRQPIGFATVSVGIRSYSREQQPMSKARIACR